MTTAVAEVEKMEEEVSTVSSQAVEIRINNNQDYIHVGETLKKIKQKRKAINDVFGPIRKKSLEAHQENLLQQKKLEDPLIEAEKVLKTKMIVWNDEQERLQRIEQARLEAEAKKKEEEAQLAEAIAAEEAGETEEAEAIMEEPVAVPVFVAPKLTPKVSGQSYSTTYKAEVVSLMALVKAVAEGKVPQQSLKVNEPFLNSQARAFKESFSYPGVKLIKQRSMSVGSR